MRVENLPPRSEVITRVVCISDTHERHNDIDVPEGDILLCAGDLLTINRHFSVEHSINKLKGIAEWMKSLPHAHKIFIGGNHDQVMEFIGKEKVQAIFEGCTYLEDGLATIAARQHSIRVWGSPYSRGSSENRAFQSNPVERINAIPKAIDILMTHGPLHEENLLSIRPRLHICGHIHKFYGVHSSHGIVRCNAAIMDRGYHPSHRPIVCDIEFMTP